ncbi:MAG: hypothetical protein ACYDHT_07600 [Solirubrobacteraceae bacterium]
MTDRPSTESRRVASSQPSVVVGSPKAGSARRQSHPLLGLFPLATMALATFLVVFALMMARMQTGADPALRAGQSALGQPAASPAAITTCASGGAATATSLTASHASLGASRAIVTRSSASGLGASHDD